MKIEILLDKESSFSEMFLLTLKGISFVSDKIEEISIVKDHNFEYGSEGVYLDTTNLFSDMKKRNTNSIFDKTLFITKGAVHNTPSATTNISCISLYNTIAHELEANATKVILNLFEETICYLLTPAEKCFLVANNKPMMSNDPNIRLKLPLTDVVIVVHGMNTSAPWEKDLGSLLNAEGIKYYSAHYKDIKIGILSNSGRTKRRNTVLTKYQDMLTMYPSDKYRYTVIAHSFGTYLIFDMLSNDAIEEYPDTIIFAAPIISRRHKNWKSLVKKNIRIYLDIGRKDWVTKAAASLRLTGASYAGWSGWLGVKDSRNITVDFLSSEEYEEKISTTKVNKPINLIHEGKRHSDYFDKSHMKKRWMPLIKIN